MKYNFPVTKNPNPKEKPDPQNLGFAKYFTDHMFVMDYDPDQGWHDGKIVPYAPFSIDPASCVLHYAQTVFEGMKAYKTASGDVQVFRPDMNIARINKTNERMCIPQIEPELFMDALTQLLDVERDWVPSAPGTSLYIRPFIFANEVSLGVHPAHHYNFMIILTPVGAYYAANEGGTLDTTKIYVEDEYIRAAQGGTGFAKCGGNYAGGMLGTVRAIENGCSDVLWLDAAEHKYIEEVGTSNAFVVINDEVITAPLMGTILPGITRNSVITLLKKWGVKVTERRLAIEEVAEASKNGTLQEVFASGTAAVITPIGCLNYQKTDYQVADGKVGPIAQKLYDTIYGMQTGDVEDDMGWIITI